MAKRAAIVLAGLISIIFWTSASADVYRGDTKFPDILEIVITGDITQRDLSFFSSRSKDLETKQVHVWLDSRGGDVVSAMEIGRIIRSVDGWTYIGDNARCYSSCALIFIAGVDRYNYGEFGLHRPYFASAPLSREQIEKQMPVMRSAVKKYVEEMGITDSFFERMFNTEPSAIEIYRGDESEKIVPHTDPTYDEIATSNQAQQYGVTTSEIRRRESLWNSTCATFFPYQGSGDRKKFVDCYLSIMWGLSVEDYRSRSAKATAKCGAEYSDSEKQIISATPRKERFSLPFAVRRRTCFLNTMSGK